MKYILSFSRTIILSFFMVASNMISYSQKSDVKESLFKQIDILREKMEKDIVGLKKEFTTLLTKSQNSEKNKTERKSLDYKNDAITKTEHSISPSIIKKSLPLKRDIKITSGFGYRYHPILGKRLFHNGVDLRCKVGTPVYAVLSGVVDQTGYNKRIGNFVHINHGKYQTIYGHLQRVLVIKGQKIDAGVKIGLSGNTGMSTGPHLHFGLYSNKKAIDPGILLNEILTN